MKPIEATGIRITQRRFSGSKLISYKEVAQPHLHFMELPLGASSPTKTFTALTDTLQRIPRCKRLVVPSHQGERLQIFPEGTEITYRKRAGTTGQAQVKKVPHLNFAESLRRVLQQTAKRESGLLNYDHVSGNSSPMEPSNRKLEVRYESPSHNPHTDIQIGTSYPGRKEQTEQ